MGQVAFARDETVKKETLALKALRGAFFEKVEEQASCMEIGHEMVRRWMKAEGFNPERGIEEKKKMIKAIRGGGGAGVEQALKMSDLESLSVLSGTWAFEQMVADDWGG